MANCKRHPNTETNLYCNKCGDPICPRCMIQTPVGARCPACARMSRIPTYNVPKIYYLRAIFAGIGLAVIGGLLWGLLRYFIPFFFLNLILAAAVGYGISEGIGLSTNRKRGIGLAVVGGLTVITCYLVSVFTFWSWHFNFIDIIAVIIGIFVSVSRLR